MYEKDGKNKKKTNHGHDEDSSLARESYICFGL
jgi:hypothetical protein